MKTRDNKSFAKLNERAKKICDIKYLSQTLLILKHLFSKHHGFVYR
jgi:hypothetical protein